ncbi:MULTISPECIES: pyridoxal phosphate-dependent aminotransferase [Clostridium]|uniref:Aminotransferase n=3 Tax=Clostridium TaxID=1485 RepID=A0AAP9RG21_CLOBU|nr:MULTISPECIES: pyridoxal phosphate-dependent aminotransferase [Clostridium]KIU08892.1 aspartate aminotransferase [Clostridium butyricum]KJZ89036.1 Biosynthetic Aromatic amino acid aminotransferase alpha/Aspartate aminotransferase [Clostridium sp. IBUN125C]KJZ89129.1 Biosynthetic Aromatic amino acid aminotransferase alpha/Aspartate aminotransferase [Clostridium sp. IBUN22A]KJZ95070.1 Biosynthetic Aromatic amino acid aminotransferase alpha/Aspartate aminotransferase [Clostridium sp. IBUN62F]MB
MISKKMYELGSKKSTIRSIFEYGRARAKVVGEENIYDFSLGNPNVPTPKFITETMIDILQNEDPCSIHGYTVAQGDPECRELLAKSLNKRFGTNFTGKNLFMTAGAAASITICFKALAEENDEFITFAPYFPEYKCFVESTGAELKVVPAKVDDFQINFPEFEKMINKNTKGIIVNSPNNPSGAVYSEETIIKLTNLLREKEKEYGHPIFLIADEPYREVAYNNVLIPYLPKYYDNTLVCYSYSKSFSLPGERIGYIVIPDEIVDFNMISASIGGAARVLTHVNAPALFQKVVARCADMPSDITVYEKNKELLYNGLIEAGFECTNPGGAFYLFPKALEDDEVAFCERAKKYDLLLVPGGDFGCPGYFRASYCISTETIKKSLPLFKKLAEEYKK